jgi:hypothetical protein
MYINAGIPDCPASGQSGTGMKKPNAFKNLNAHKTTYKNSPWADRKTRSGTYCICIQYIQYINAGMPDCPASGQSGTEMKKLTVRNRSGTGLSRCHPAFFDPAPQ